MKKLSPNATMLLNAIASTVTRKYSKSFEVFEVGNKVTLKDVEQKPNIYDSDKLTHVEMPKFPEGTPAAVRKIVMEAVDYVNKEGYNLVTPIPVKYIDSAEFQRTIDLQRIIHMAINFDKNIFDPIRVYYDEKTGTLKVNEGDHRAGTIILLGRSKVQAIITPNQTTQEAAHYYKVQNGNKKKLTFQNMVEAGIAEQDPTTLAICTVCNLFRIKLRSETSYPKTVNSISKIYKIMKDYGETGLKVVFQMICDAGWENQTKAYYDTTLSLGYALLDIIRTSDGEFDYDEFVEWLQSFKTCGDCLTAMNDDVKEFVVAKHPEKTPAIYMNKHFGV